MLSNTFFDNDPQWVAKELLGKVLRSKYQKVWLSARIIETEAYYREDKSSHSSLGFTEKRKALFMPPGTIYMYYARGGDSMNVSCRGEGNAVLIKAAYPHLDQDSSVLALMQANHLKDLSPRAVNKLCSGQTLLCKSLGITVADWDKKNFDINYLFIEDMAIYPKKIIKTTRLGIPIGRDEHLMYRFIDYDYAAYCTKNPLTKRNWQINKEYYIVDKEENFYAT